TKEYVRVAPALIAHPPRDPRSRGPDPHIHPPAYHAPALLSPRTPCPSRAASAGWKKPSPSGPLSDGGHQGRGGIALPRRGEVAEDALTYPILINGQE